VGRPGVGRVPPPCGVARGPARGGTRAARASARRRHPGALGDRRLARMGGRPLLVRLDDVGAAAPADAGSGASAREARLPRRDAARAHRRRRVRRTRPARARVRIRAEPAVEPCAPDHLPRPPRPGRRRRPRAAPHPPRVAGCLVLRHPARHLARHLAPRDVAPASSFRGTHPRTDTSAGGRADPAALPTVETYPDEGGTMIEARGLSKRYGDRVAVDDISFTIEPGHVTGFLGPNGAGKSTTMRMIVGLTRPTSGSVTIAGQRYAELRSPLTTVGALLDAKAVHSGRTAYHHLLGLAATHGIPTARVREVIELTGLDAVAGKRVKGFSLGMGQRLGIAAALLGDPQVLLFDEPVNGLDPEGVRWVRNFARY